MQAGSVALIVALRKRFPGSNRKFLSWFMLILLILFVLYSILFQVFNAYEAEIYDDVDRESFTSGIYWTLVVMSTQGFGDITFRSDIGRIFTMLVNITGLIIMMVVLPTVIIEFIYNPLLNAQKEASAPRVLPETMKGHVLITHYDSVADAFISRLNQHKIPYAVIVEEVATAYALSDRGINVLVGDRRQTETYRNARADQAALVSVTSESDPINTNIVFTIRQVSEVVPIVSFANHVDSIDILELAGSNQVLDISDLMGKALARSTSNDGVAAHVMGQINELRIVEARVSGTDLVGKTIKEADLGRKLNVTVIGVWERGNFELAGANTKITEHSILVMAGSETQLSAYNEQFSADFEDGNGVVILGAGNVGLAAARYLREYGTPFTIIDKEEPKDSSAAEFAQNIVLGDAADLNFLKSTLFFEASAILITTHDDDINIFLTLYFRKLRPGVQILARANFENNVSMLHRAGADFVLSSSTMASMKLFNHLKRGHLYTMVEGLSAIQVKIPPKMVGKSLVNLQFRALTGCSVIALIQDGQTKINPSPFEPLPDNIDIIMVLTPEAEAKYMKHFNSSDSDDENKEKA